MPRVEPFRILVVCTANICRSVMAEQFLLRELERRRLAGVEVASCGLLFDGEPASDTVAAVLAESSLDVSGHRSRVFSPGLVRAADLIVTMERTHVREITMAVEGARAKTHTLGALVQWFRESVELQSPPRQRVHEFAETRRSSEVLGSGSDEVEDPHGRSRRMHRRSAQRIDDLCVGLLDGLFGAAGDD